MQKLSRISSKSTYEDKALILLAKNIMATESWKKIPDFNNPKWIQDKEFRVYSQFGDDGIIQWLIYFLNIKDNNFIEFGVEDFYESNSHFLLINNTWNGFVLDSSTNNLNNLKKSDIYWRYNIKAKQAFITKENINSLVMSSNFTKLGYLHIDLDGNDYWILEELDLSVSKPDLLILEYNAIYGNKEAISIPYEEKFNRMKVHYSGKYYGASLQALSYLADKKGYYFIGCNSAGNNAYFIDKNYETVIPKTNIKLGFQAPSFRESRNIKGELNYYDLSDQKKEIKNLKFIDVKTGILKNL